MNANIQASSLDSATVVSLPMDLDKANERLMKIVAISDLLEDLGRLEMNADEDAGKEGHLLPFHLQLIGSTLSDVACDLLDMVSAEEHRQKKESDED